MDLNQRPSGYEPDVAILIINCLRIVLVEAEQRFVGIRHRSLLFNDTVHHRFTAGQPLV
jgi:hypothetical protein